MSFSLLLRPSLLSANQKVIDNEVSTLYFKNSIMSNTWGICHMVNELTAFDEKLKQYFQVTHIQFQEILDFVEGHRKMPSQPLSDPNWVKDLF